MAQEFGLKAKIEPEVDEQAVEREVGTLERYFESITATVTPDLDGLAGKAGDVASTGASAIGTVGRIGAGIAQTMVGDPVGNVMDSVPAAADALPGFGDIAGGVSEVGLGAKASKWKRCWSLLASGTICSLSERIWIIASLAST